MTKMGVWRPWDSEQVSENPLPRIGGGFSLALLATVAHRAMLVIMACFVLILSLVVVPTLLGYPALTVRGGSMGDAVPLGSLAITRWLPVDEVEAGDVIVIRHPDSSPVIHRVVTIVEQDGAFVVETKGDANRAADPGYSVLNDRVAVHTYTIPYLGYAADFLRTPLGWTLFVLLPISALCLLTLRSIWLGDDKPAAAAGTAYDSGRSPSRPPSGLRRPLLPRLLPLAGAALIPVVLGLVFLADGLADSDDSSLAGTTTASTSEPSADTAPLAAWDGDGWQFNLTSGGVPSRPAAPTSGGGGLNLGTY